MLSNTARSESKKRSTDFDVVVIGAGFAGLYQLYMLRELGLRVRGLEAGSDVGGVWHWNRYPGARLDSESYSYCYSFSEELLREWSWSERFVGQPELNAYFKYVADKFDLRKDIRFNSRVRAAKYEGRNWSLTTEDGHEVTTRFVVLAVGPLSAPVLPAIEGRDSFAGTSLFAPEWPKDPVDFRRKRVAVIGTGATGIQIIQEVAKSAGSLTVLQRTPNWAVPLNNGPIDEDTQREIKAGYKRLFDHCRSTPGGFVHAPRQDSALDVTCEERESFLEKLYASSGLGLWQGNFRDMGTNPRSNAIVTEFVARKIRARVKDPEVAERLIPKDHGFGLRRVPLETNYYEVYNQRNVRLVDVRATPIEAITPQGIRTSDESFDFDIIIYAAGYDAITGGFDRIDISNESGRRLRNKWSEGLSSLVGMMVDEFPNLFMILGPYSALGNAPRSIEYNVEWVTRLLMKVTQEGVTRVEATPEAVAEWVAYSHSTAEGLLSAKIKSWMTGVNTNISGKEEPSIFLYRGTAQAYREWAERIAASGYEPFIHLN